jgi:hypothetical protein
VAFVRGPEPSKQIPNGSSGALLETAPASKRARLTKNEKEVIDKLRVLHTDPHSARRMDLSFLSKGKFSRTAEVSLELGKEN